MHELQQHRCRRFFRLPRHLATLQHHHTFGLEQKIFEFNYLEFHWRCNNIIVRLRLTLRNFTGVHRRSVCRLGLRTHSSLAFQSHWAMDRCCIHQSPWRLLGRKCEQTHWSPSLSTSHKSPPIQRTTLRASTKCFSTTITSLGSNYKSQKFAIHCIARQPRAPFYKLGSLHGSYFV